MTAFRDPQFTDLFIFAQLVIMTNDNTGLNMSEEQKDTMEETVREHYPEAFIMFSAYLLEAFDCGGTRRTLADELDLPPDSTYLDIARARVARGALGWIRS